MKRRSSLDNKSTRKSSVVAANFCSSISEGGHAVAARKVQAILCLFLCHFRERGNLPEEVLYRLSRASEHLGAWGHIRHDACLGSDFRAVTDAKMPGQARLASNTDEVPQRG